MTPGSIGGLVGALFIAAAHGAAAQGPFFDPANGPGKAFHFGITGAALVAGSPGLAVGGVVALEWKRLLISAEVTAGETFSGWDAFMARGQAGVILTDAAIAPYVLAGVEHSTMDDVINERRGRIDFALTGEAGYLFQSVDGGRQLWLGIRCLVPITSHVYSNTSPQLPVAVLVVKYLL